MDYNQSACGRQVHVRVAVSTTGGGGGGGGVEKCVEYTDTKSYDKPRTGSPTQTQAWHTHTNTRAQIYKYIYMGTHALHMGYIPSLQSLQNTYPYESIYTLTRTDQ